MKTSSLLLAMSLLAGCPAVGPDDVQHLSDQDGDGYLSPLYGGDDCNDRAPTVYPGADEICDEFDNDCDGAVNMDDDEPYEVLWYRDADGDGFPDEATTLETCMDFSGLPGRPWFKATETFEFDCNDQDPTEHPGQVWGFDGDGDGFPGDGAQRIQCTRPDDFVAEPLTDCDDFEPTRYPGAIERCNDTNDDCDDQILDVDDDDVAGIRTYYLDYDGDGFGAEPGTSKCAPDPMDLVVGGDCNDLDPLINPSAEPLPYDGIDQDCWPDDDFDHDGHYRNIDDADDTAPWINDSATTHICDGRDDITGAILTDVSAEEGAYFVGPDNDDRAAPDHIRTLTTYTGSFSTGQTVTLPDNGELFLCHGQPWTGLVFASGQSTTITGLGTSPVVFGGSVALTASQARLTNLEIGMSLSVSKPLANPAVSGVELTDVTVPYANFDSAGLVRLTNLVVDCPYPECPLAVNSERQIEVLGGRAGSMSFSGGAASLFVGVDPRTQLPLVLSSSARALFINGIDKVSLEAVEFTGAPATAVQARRVDAVSGCALAFGDAAVHLDAFGELELFEVLDGTSDFTCDDTECDEVCTVLSLL